MKIRKLTATFGRLENETLSLHEGLNVIYAPNESGKSTWCAFIRTMLYGVDSAERSRAGHLPDKLRYAPWSGTPMGGVMELTAERRDITLVRSTKAKSAPMREFSATYSGTNIPVEGMTGANCGEMLTGVSKEVFCRSAFIEQGTVAVTGSPELEKRISAIVSTGEEQSSYSEADERLRAWQRKRRYNRRGLLPELEGKMYETQQLLDDMGASAEDVQKLEERLEQTRQRCESLEAQVTECRRQQRREALDRLNSGRTALREQSETHDAALSALDERRQALRQSPFGERPLQEVEAQVGKDLEDYADYETQKGTSRALWPAILCFVLALAAAAVYSARQLWPLIAVAAVFCAAAVVLMLRYSKVRQASRQAEEAQRQILKRYLATAPEDLTAMLDDYRALWAQVERAEAQELAERQRYEQLRAQQTALEEQAIADLDFTGGSSRAAQLSRQLNAERAEASRLSSQIAKLNGRLSAMGDPLVLSSSLSCMQEEYRQLQAEYDAISLAVDALRDADAEIQSRFSPQLGRVAAGYMSMVTGGRYEDVLINRDFSARTRTADDAVPRDAEYLSAGTMDLMYLAVRLAVCELALPEGEPCPLIIDDALVNLDETRFAQAMKLLEEISRERQVILFTCRK